MINPAMFSPKITDYTADRLRDRLAALAAFWGDQLPSTCRTAIDAHLNAADGYPPAYRWVIARQLPKDCRYQIERIAARNKRRKGR